MYDLMVIGAGLAGLAAAHAAVEAGLRVRVIAKGLGSLFWGAGTIDVLGYVPGERNGAVERPRDRLPALLAARPGHPYALIPPGDIFAALDEFAALTARANLPYVTAPAPGANFLLPSPAGVARPTWLAPATQAGGDLTRPEPMLIAGFRGLRDFFPDLIAENLRKQGHAARAEFLPLSVITDRPDYNSTQLAARLDDRLVHVRLGTELSRLVRPGERIGLPAILGLKEHPGVMAELGRRTGTTVFEIPTLPASVPGFRLYTALRADLERRGVTFGINMPVTGWRGDDGRVEWVETETSSRPLRQQAARYLLATGGILGGGISSDHTGRVWENVFGLPLAAPEERSEWFRPGFLDPAGHPIFQGGVPVNARFQPLAAGGEPALVNVWAAGGVLAHADPIQERSLEGLAVVTGMTAARQAARG